MRSLHQSMGGGESLKNERTPRKKYINLRVSKKEQERISEQAKSNGLSVSECLREFGLEQTLKQSQLDKATAKEWRRLLFTIGNHLNQLTRKANAGQVQVISLNEVQEELSKIWQLLNFSLRKNKLVTAICNRTS
jgi:Bacterial mobilisation protein (MobC)